MLEPLGQLIVIELSKIGWISKLENRLEPSLRRSISIKSLDYQRVRAITDFQDSLKKYLDHISDQEAKPFISLLKPEQEDLVPQNEDSEGRQNQQENEILRIIRDVLKHDPQKLPPIPQGKRWVKADVRKILVTPRQLHKLFQSEAVFNKAWERLRITEKIKVVSE